jgi:3-hydroxy-9,10-secoandrosta-1,3,5(10)-triene-9,17-dione monooxygenase reductase component
VTNRLLSTDYLGRSDWTNATLRETLGHFCSGVTVLSALHHGEPVGMTCQSFFSVSLDPPIIAFCVGRNSKSFPLIREAGSCIVNILAESQRDLSGNFAKSGTDKWANVKWGPSVRRTQPILRGALAWIECDINDVLEAGDHLLVLGDVVDIGHQPGERPLLYFRSSYANLHVVDEQFD